MRISLKAARHNIGLTQEGLAKEVNVSKKTIGSWENGITMPSVDKIEPLCNVLGVKYDDIKWKA